MNAKSYLSYWIKFFLIVPFALGFINVSSCAHKPTDQPIVEGSSPEATKTEEQQQSRMISNTDDPGVAPSLTPERLVEITNLKLGTYSLTKGSPILCQSGALVILNLGTELTIMLGAHALVLGIGKGEFEETDDICVTKYNTVLSMNQIKGERLVTCSLIDPRTGKIPTPKKFSVTIDLNENKLSYKRLITQGGRILRNESCKLTLIPLSEISFDGSGGKGKSYRKFR